MGKIRIGDLARETGVSVRSLRHYEQVGLLAPGRDENGYRFYQPRSLGQVREIRRLLKLGFSLAEIALFPQCMRDDPGPGLCPVAAEAHRRRLAEIEAQIDSLERQREELVRTLQR
jgi:MerR family copper efflux transcriptional regulator